MIYALDYFRQLNFAGIALRLVMAMICGGLIGLSRERLHRPKGLAGFRTYMLVCVGAALTIIISQYEYIMVTTRWSDVAATVGIKTDVSRFGAQVINGIGFLGAGTIIVTSNDKIKGLTTAAGLWASACMGLAIGAGFYECAVIAVLFIYLAMYVFSNLNSVLLDLSPAVSLCVEVETMADIGEVVMLIRHHGAKVMNMSLLNRSQPLRKRTEMEILIGLPAQMTATTMMVEISHLEHVKHVVES